MRPRKKLYVTRWDAGKAWNGGNWRESTALMRFLHSRRLLMAKYTLKRVTRISRAAKRLPLSPGQGSALASSGASGHKHTGRHDG